MTAVQQVNEFIWKPGRSGKIDFCGNFKRLSEKEPKTAAMLLGHFEEEGFQTEDAQYTYKVYHSQYGYSVGRRKKSIVIPDIEESLQLQQTQSVPLAKTFQSAEIAIHDTSEQVLVRIAVALEGIDKTLKSMGGSK